MFRKDVCRAPRPGDIVSRIAREAKLVTDTRRLPHFSPMFLSRSWETRGDHCPQSINGSVVRSISLVCDPEAFEVTPHRRMIREQSSDSHKDCQTLQVWNRWRCVGNRSEGYRLTGVRAGSPSEHEDIPRINTKQVGDVSVPLSEILTATMHLLQGYVLPNKHQVSNLCE